MTSVEYAGRIPEDPPSRHPPKENLGDLADLVLDGTVPAGNAVLTIERRIKAGGIRLLIKTCMKGSPEEGNPSLGIDRSVGSRN